MWKALCLIGIVLGAISILVSCIALSQKQIQQQESHSPTINKDESEQLHSKSPRSFGEWLSYWWSGTDDTTAYFTGWLAITTALLGIVACVQICFLWRADITARNSSDTARDALIKVQRAFVFVDTFDTQYGEEGISVRPIWRNSGTTPTRFMTNHVNFVLLPGDLPDNFQFPDYDESGHEIPPGAGENIPLFVGPQATKFGGSADISQERVVLLATGRGRLFIWGWAAYEDVFGGRHITKFCNEIMIKTAATEYQQIRIIKAAPIFPSYKRHNCTDEECDKQKPNLS